MPKTSTVSRSTRSSRRVGADQAEGADTGAAGCRGWSRAGTRRPISGRFRITSIRLPAHIDTIRPQKICGWLVTTCGPGTMPWMIIAPIISAMTALAGIRAPASERTLRAASLAGRPGDAVDCADRTARGRGSFFSRLKAAKEARQRAAAGHFPGSIPSSVPRAMGSADAEVARVGSSVPIAATEARRSRRRRGCGGFPQRRTTRPRGRSGRCRRPSPGRRT